MSSCGFKFPCFCILLFLALPLVGAQCPELELKDNLQTKQLLIDKPLIEHDTITSRVSCLPEKFLDFAKENNIGFPIICYSGCPRYSVIGYTFLGENNTLKGSMPCGHAGDQVSVTFTVFDTNYTSDEFNGTSDSIPLVSCTGDTGLKVVFAGPNVTQKSRSITIMAETNDNARCRWGDTSERYTSMTRQFSTGDGTRAHSTQITAPEGESKVYISCMDMSGNQMQRPELLKLKVSLDRQDGLCIDTDGGKDPFVRGTCTDQETSGKEWTDSCTGKGNIVESFCDKGKCEFETIGCKNSNCADGVCMYDSDADGVADEADLCPGTKKDAETDHKGCAQEQLHEANIVYTTPERISYRQGETAVFTVKVKNTGTETIQNLWAGLDIYSPEGVRIYRTKTPNATDGTLQFNTDCRGGSLAPGSTRECTTEAQLSALPKGEYKVKAAIWTDVPGVQGSLISGSKTGFLLRPRTSHR